MQRIDLRNAERFLGRLRDNEPRTLDPDSDFRLLIREGRGSVMLNASEAAEYGRVLSELEEKAERLGFGRHSVDLFLGDAVFDVLQISGQAGLEFPQRLNRAVSGLGARLRIAPLRHLCYVQVAGLSGSDLPGILGRVRFVTFGESHLRRFRNAMRTHEVSDQQKDLRLTEIRKLRKSRIWGQPCGEVVIAAADYEAAVQQARRVVRDTADVANFVLGNVPFLPPGWLFLPEEGSATRDLVPVLRSDSSAQLAHSRRGPIAPVDLVVALRHRSVRALVRRIQDLLKNARPSKLDQTLLAAVQWAGRASRASVREEAFLLSAIALECVMLPESSSSDVSYRLRIRTAHLLGRDGEYSDVPGHPFRSKPATYSGRKAAG